MQYMTPEMEYVKFQVKDVLAASETQGFNPDAEQGGGWNAGQGSEGFEIG